MSLPPPTLLLAHAGSLSKQASRQGTPSCVVPTRRKERRVWGIRDIPIDVAFLVRMPLALQSLESTTGRLNCLVEHALMWGNLVSNGLVGYWRMGWSTAVGATRSASFAPKTTLEMGKNNRCLFWVSCHKICTSKCRSAEVEFGIPVDCEAVRR